MTNTYLKMIAIICALLCSYTHAQSQITLEQANNRINIEESSQLHKDIDNLLNYVVQNPDYSLSEKDYQSDNPYKIVFLYFSIIRSLVDGDADRLLERLKFINKENPSKRFDHIIDIIADIETENPYNTKENTSLKINIEQSPDWYVTFISAVKNGTLHAYSFKNHTRQHYLTQRMALLINNEPTDAYKYANATYDQFVNTQIDYSANIHNMTRAVHKRLQRAQAENIKIYPATNLHNILNIIDQESNLYISAWKKLLSLDYNSTNWKSQTISLYLAHNYSLTPQEKINWIEKIDYQNNLNEFWKLFDARLAGLYALETGNPDLIEKYTSRKYFREYLNERPISRVSLLYKKYKNKITIDEYAKIQREIHLFKNLEQRQLLHIPYSIGDIDSQKKLSQKDNLEHIERELKRTKKLSTIDQINLTKILKTISSTNRFAQDNHESEIINIADRYFARLPIGSTDTNSPTQKYLTKEINEGFIATLNKFNKTNILESTIYNQRDNQTLIKYVNDEEKPLRALEKTYYKLFQISLDIKSGDIKNAWSDLSKLRLDNELPGSQKKHIILDINRLESQLLFLESNTSAFLEKILIIIEESVKQKRHLDNDSMLGLLSLNLIENGYYAEALKTTDEWSNTHSKKSMLPTILKARIKNVLENLEVNTVELEEYRLNAKNDKEISLINAELLSHYININDHKNIKIYKTILIESLSSDENLKLFEELQPLILRANYILEKNVANGNPEKHYSNFLKALANQSQKRRNKSAALTEYKLQAKSKIMEDSIQRLEASNKKNEKQKDLINNTMLATLGLIILLMGLLWYLHRMRMNNKKTSNELSSQENTINKNQKNAYSEITRFHNDVQTLTDDIREQSSNMGVLALLDKLDKTTNQYRAILTETTYKNRSDITNPKPLFEEIKFQHRMKEIENFWKRQINSSMVKFSMTYDNEIDTITTDAHYIDIIVNEMLTLSKSTTEQGSIDLEIKVKPDEKIIVIKATDTGNSTQSQKLDYVKTKHACSLMNGTTKFAPTKNPGFMIEASLKILDSKKLEYETNKSNVITTDFSRKR